MRRREFIMLLGGAAAAWPLMARAQQPALPVVGLLGPGSRDSDAFRIAALRQGLKEVGYVEGQTVTIEYRGAEGHYDRFPALVADFVRRQVSVIATGSTPAAQAAKAITTTVPIVFTLAADPVQLHLVASLNRPGGNLTGVTVLGTEIGPKRLELLHELIPTTQVMALLINPTNPGLAETISRDAQVAARVLGLQLHVLRASTAREIDDAFATLRQVRAGGLVLSADTFFTSRIDQLVALSRRDAVPTIYHTRDFAVAGGLMSYATDFSESWRQAGIASGRILRGEKPADLPVQEAVKVELVINLQTAKAFGIEIPPALLIRADEVIE
jgi:putative tryptophan/tyrosine transport system substrate-binding protein